MLKIILSKNSSFVRGLQRNKPKIVRIRIVSVVSLGVEIVLNGVHAFPGMPGEQLT